MPPRDPQVVLQKLQQTSLKVDSFFLRQTGFIANQTILKLGEYNLNCIPATIGLEVARFLAVLTPSEANLFSKMKEGTHILILTFDNPDNRDVARFPLRVGLVDIESIPDRKNVCFLHLKLKSLPAELVLFLGAYMEELEARMKLWEDLGAHPIAFSPDLVVSSGLGLGVVLAGADWRLSVDIVQFSTKNVELGWPEGSPPSHPEGACQLRLMFQGRPVNLEGVLKADSFLPEFHPDWLDFVENTQFHENIRKHRTKPGAS